VINRIINLGLDLLIGILLFLVAPLLYVLLTIPGPVYAKIIGIVFILLVSGAVFSSLRSTKKNKEK
jgi:uncharacterized RDD family membrane protein YckC